MPQLNRWLPLLGLLVLVCTTLLRLVGAVTQSQWVESIGDTLKLPMHSPIGAAEVALAVAAAYGVGRKLYSMFIDSLKAKGGWRRWVPIGATVGLVVTVVLRAKGQAGLADMLDAVISVHAPVSPAELGGAVAGGYGVLVALYSSAQRALAREAADSDR